jgi:hypothetical protein
LAVEVTAYLEKFICALGREPTVKKSQQFLLLLSGASTSQTDFFEYGYI